jgi:transposase
MEERRREGRRRLQEGTLSQAAIARSLGVSRAAGAQWKQQREKSGLRGLRARKAPGRPPGLTSEDQRWVRTRLGRGARAAGFATERWTQRRIQQVLRQEVGVVYHAHYVGRLMKQWGWSVQKPVARARERQERVIRAWLSQDWPRSKKARRLDAAILVEDEFGFSFAEAPATTWAPRGPTPVLKRVGKSRREISTMVGLTLSGKIYKRHFQKTGKAPEVVKGLTHFRRQLAGPLILIWARSRTPRAQVGQDDLAAHPEIVVEELPAYAPEVTPGEFCPGNIKGHLKNALPLNGTEGRQALDGGFARLRRRPDLVLSFSHQAGLTVKQLW